MFATPTASKWSRKKKRTGKLYSVPTNDRVNLENLALTLHMLCHQYGLNWHSVVRRRRPLECVNNVPMNSHLSIVPVRIPALEA